MLPWQINKTCIIANSFPSLRKLAVCDIFQVLHITIRFSPRRGLGVFVISKCDIKRDISNPHITRIFS